MPELPEVETIKETLKQLTLNKTIKTVEVFRDKTILGNKDEFIKELSNNSIINFERIGKFIIFHLTDNKVLISHLRMEGKFFLKDENAKNEKHDLVIFHFIDSTKLVYNDTRKFGIMKLSNENNYKIEEPLKKVGPDPFLINNPDYLLKSFKNKSIAIKTALLDQSIMSGLGNIYVDEVLFETKIHPETPANMVNKTQLKDILENSKKVLQKAIIAGGTTIKSYHPKEGVSGKFQVELKAYGKQGKPCPRCGNEMRKISVNGRGTTYCPNCQKNIALPKVYGLTGPIASGKSTVLKILKNKNYKIINCDEIVHKLYEQKSVQTNISSFIPNLKIENNQIDRKWLKNYLLDNKAKKRRLEKFIHSLVTKEVEKEIKMSKEPIVIEAPLLFESKLNLLCDEIIYVDVSKERQILNLKARGDEVSSSLKLNNNFDKENKKKATIIIKNNKDIAYLEKQINTIF